MFGRIWPTLLQCELSFQMLSISCLQVIQNKALRILGDHDNHTRTEQLHSDVQELYQHILPIFYQSSSKIRNTYIRWLDTLPRYTYPLLSQVSAQLCTGGIYLILVIHAPPIPISNRSKGVESHRRHSSTKPSQEIFW